METATTSLQNFVTAYGNELGWILGSVGALAFIIMLFRVGQSAFKAFKNL